MKSASYSTKVRVSKTLFMRNACDEDLNLLPFFKDVGDKFPISLRKYFAGMIDGDGSINIHKRKKKL